MPIPFGDPYSVKVSNALEIIMSAPFVIFPA